MKGNLIKLKHGYNPNSSSIGTGMSAFLWGSAAFSVTSAALLAAVIALRGGNRNNEEIAGPDSKNSGDGICAGNNRFTKNDSE